MKKKLLHSWTFLRKHLSIIRIFAVSFIVIMLFVDDNSFLQSFLYDRKIRELKKEIEHYQGVIENSQQQLNELRSNSENLEKFAREQYLMKKSNEDIYIIEDSKNE